MSYRTDRVEIVHTFQYNDSANDHFEREPYSVLIRSKEEGGGKIGYVHYWGFWRSGVINWRMHLCKFRVQNLFLVCCWGGTSEQDPTSLYLLLTNIHSHINSHTSWYPHSPQVSLSSSLLVYARSPLKPSVKSMHLLMSMMRLSITMALRMGSSWVTLMRTAPISLKGVTTCYNWSQTHDSPGYWILMLIRPLRIATVHMTGVCVCVYGGGKVGVCVVGWRGG